MNTRYMALAGLALGALLTTGCVAPKVMVDQGFLGDEHTVKILMQKNAAGTFDQSLRICTIEGGADNDSLYGEDGADTIHGGDGSDLLLNGGADGWVELQLRRLSSRLGAG